MTFEYDLKSFPNPDGTWAVRGKVSAMKDGKPVIHADKKTPVFAEHEESTPDGPAEGQDLMAWGLKFAKSRSYKAKLDAKVQPQIAALGLVKPVKPATLSRIKPEDL